MNDLPILPFEKILGYLSLEDRIRSRAVSRRWCKTIDSFKVKCLFYSNHPIGFVYAKGRFISGAFASNFIHTPRFGSFFETFAQSILASLKHLRLCDLGLTKANGPAFAKTLNSFGQLEELALCGLNLPDDSKLRIKLNLPMLNSIQLEKVHGIQKLTLDAPRLQMVKLLNGFRSLRLELVHGESVEWLTTECLDIGEPLDITELKSLKNLKFLYCGYLLGIDPTFLFSVKQLKEIHLGSSRMASTLFEQKQRYGRADLKIFLSGLLLDGRNDPAIESVIFKENHLPYLAENPSRLANEIPFYTHLPYAGIEDIAPGLESNLLARFVDFKGFIVSRPVQDIERFLALLKNLGNVAALVFRCEQPQELFDRLADHCAVQRLTIYSAPSDLGFLLKCKHLNNLHLDWSIDAETIRKIVKKLFEFIVLFKFKHLNRRVNIRIHHPKRIEVCIENGKFRKCGSLNAAIQFITGHQKTRLANCNLI